MTTAEDRMWSICDAILLGLYRQSFAGERAPGIVGLMASAGWAGAPVTTEEWATATEYLSGAGYITGPRMYGQGVALAEITTQGMDQAASGRTVRPGADQPANVTGVSNTYNITNNAPSQMAFSSSDFTQNMTVQAKVDRLRALSDDLDRFADQQMADSTEVHRLTRELRTAANDPEQNSATITALFASLLGAITTAAGTTAGQQMMQQVLAFMPVFS
ncbi:hypothetical protein [Nocardia sp. CC201C]|uniref:hypothetical protein n=1 Tax=Nocardia sp. CC201C TaxID=3044575 RepID=UPI0024A9E2B4|nr:hypothetical protein [Nocardia sp. CC201C]